MFILVRDYLRQHKPEILSQMEGDPNLAPVLDTLMPKPNDELATNLATIGMVYHHAPGYLEAVPNVANFYVTVMKRGLRLRTIADNAVVRRPTEEGLPQALLMLAKFRERFFHTKLSSLNSDPATMRSQVAHIQALRGAVAPTISTLRVMLRNLALLENTAKTEMKEDYDLIRTLAKADIDLAEMEEIEHYLYGPAEKAAESRRDNRRTFEDMTIKAEQKGLADATRKARSVIAEEFDSLLKDLRRTEPVSPTDDRKDPR